MITALLSINWVMSGAGRSDSAGRLFAVWHVNANLLIAIGRASGTLVIRADRDLLTLHGTFVDWSFSILARAASSEESL